MLIGEVVILLQHHYFEHQQLIVGFPAGIGLSFWIGEGLIEYSSEDLPVDEGIELLEGWLVLVDAFKLELVVEQSWHGGYP